MSVPSLLRRFLLFSGLFLGILAVGCRSPNQENQTTSEAPAHHKKHHKHHRADTARTALDQQRNPARQAGATAESTTAERIQTGSIPQKARDVLTFVRANKRAMDGYVGGRRFGNFENHLPRSDAGGQSIDYQEWDVNPKVQGRNRGTERLITGSDGRAWYTNDHYNTFTEVK